MDVREFIKNNIMLMDGAIGTMLQKSGLKLGENPDVWNITNPDAVRAVHAAYIKAGSNMIVTNTFGANAYKLLGSGYSVEQVIAAAVKTAREAASGTDVFVALDIGPVGELMEPMGTLSFDDAYKLFREQVLAGAEAGADAVCIETMTDLHEAKCAVLAVKENCGLPVFCTMSFERDMRTFTGVSIPAMAITLEGLGVDAVGINCSAGPAEMIGMFSELIKWTNLPIIIQPNAGIPSVIDGETVFTTGSDDFADEMRKVMDLGAGIVGGCCGTTPEFIENLAGVVEGRKAPERERLEICALCSPTQVVPVDRVRIIGERINPTGKKRFQEALRENDTDYIAAQAIEQVNAGADILDVNVGLPGINEKAVMSNVVKSLQSVVSVPLQIDSSNAETLEAGLRTYCGKAIVNSVNGDDEMLEKILPIVKKYGAAVVGLTLDKNGIPKTAGERYVIAEKIVDAALKYGIPKSDIFIDCLTLTSGAEQDIACETLKALPLVKEGLGVKTVLGVSNISFGLPARETMNQVFLSMALANGLDMPIINPNVKSMVDTVYCFHQLKNIDSGSHEYIKRFRSNEKTIENKIVQTSDISYYIENGLKDGIKPTVENLLSGHDALEVVNEFLIPSLDAVGKRYERGEIFLPQLLQSAEAAKAAFEVIKREMSVDADRTGNKIILATVEGDIHDIGKNIVKTVLENYGYTVIDLGRDVKVSSVADEAIKGGVGLIGLSALMTTTVESMERTIKDIKAKGCVIPVMVGGAVLTEKFAKEIGADFYGRDAMAAVAIAKKVFTAFDVGMK